MTGFKSWLLNVVPQDLLLDENTMRATIQAAMDVTLAKPIIAILTKEMRLLARGEVMTTHTVSVLTAQERQELKKMELAHSAGDRTLPPAGNRIELADLKERVRKLEAIAAGIDL